MNYCPCSPWFTKLVKYLGRRDSVRNRVPCEPVHPNPFQGPQTSSETKVGYESDSDDDRLELHAADFCPDEESGDAPHPLAFACSRVVIPADPPWPKRHEI